MTNDPKFGVVLPAAGTGTRFGGDKLLMEIGGGQTVLQRAVLLFAGRGDVSAIALVTSPDRFEPYKEHLRKVVDESRLQFVEGGRERWESVLFGLRALAEGRDAPQFVAVHDAARPLTPKAVIDEAFRVTAREGAALPCVPEPATLKKGGSDGRVAATVDRRGLFQAQTPQCFELAALLAGYDKLLGAGQLADVTDDAQVFERVGRPVPITPGDPLNLKITTSGDLVLARAIVAAGDAAVQ